jgi:PGF-CTERM protein
VIKKIILATMVLMFAISISLAAGPQGIHEPGTGLTDPDIKEAAQGTGQGVNMDDQTNASASTPGIHEPGTGITNPEVKEAAQGTGQGLKMEGKTNASASTPGIHEPGTGITNPEVKEAAQGTGQGAQAEAAQTETPAQKTQPGFEFVFALAGLVAVAFIVLRKTI